MRRHYLVSYDVSDDKRRTGVFETLKDHGDHAQFSVFFCELNERELVGLKAGVHALINDDEDQVMFVDLGPTQNPLENDLICLGKPYNPTCRSMIV